MNKYFSLTRTLIKNTMGSLTDGKTKKGFQIILYLILFLCFIPMIFMFYEMFSMGIEAALPIQQEGTVLVTGFQVANLVTFLFSIFLIPSVFYFSKDSETLLVLPIKPEVILASKFTVCLIYEYAFSFLVSIPLLLAYVNLVEVGIAFYLIAALLLLTLPMYPLFISSIISMLVMRFVPFFKNRDRFNMIGGIVSVALAMWLSYAMNSVSLNNVDPSTLLQLLTQGDNSLLNMISYLFPCIPYGVKALIHTDIVSMLIYIGFIIAAGVVFLVMGKYFYFKGAIGFNETGSNRKKISDQNLTKTTRRKNKKYTYMMKEFKLIIRTPVYFLNCIGTTAVFPILFIFMYSTSFSDMDLSIFQYIDFSGYLPYAILVGLVAGMLFSNMNLIAATAISREGSNVMFMKYIPMDFKEQIHAKTSCGIMVSIISMLIMILLAYFVFPYLPIVYYIACFLSSCITCILGNYIGIMLDMAHPKLVWEQEAAAVKQNITAMAAMFGSWILCGLMGYAFFKLPFKSIEISTAVVVVVSIALMILLRLLVDTFAKKLFERI